MGVQETFNFTERSNKVLGEFLMSRLSYNNEETGPGPHCRISPVWFIVNGVILSDGDPTSSRDLWEPDRVRGIVLKMVSVFFDL